MNLIEVLNINVLYINLSLMQNIWKKQILLKA